MTLSEALALMPLDWHTLTRDEMVARVEAYTRVIQEKDSWQELAETTTFFSSYDADGCIGE